MFAWLAEGRKEAALIGGPPARDSLRAFQSAETRCGRVQCLLCWGALCLRLVARRWPAGEKFARHFGLIGGRRLATVVGARLASSKGKRPVDDVSQSRGNMRAETVCSVAFWHCTFSAF